MALIATRTVAATGFLRFPGKIHRDRRQHRQQLTAVGGLQRISQDQVVDRAWTPSFYGYDGGGNVRQLTNAAGAVTDTYEYDAFGNNIHRTGTTPNNYLYRAEQYDSDLGLYYLRARYYNPATGRFTSRDPEEGNASYPWSLHKYLYAAGDPINGIDPMGWEDIVEYQAKNRQTGYQLHHVIEKRFGPVLNGFVCTLSTVLTIEVHQAITNAWRAAIPYGAAGTGAATPAQIFAAAVAIDQDYPSIGAAAEQCAALAGY